MKQALSQRASVTQQEVPATSSSPASATRHLPGHTEHPTEEMPSLGHKCLLLLQGPSGPRAPHPLWLASDPANSFTHGFCLGSSGSHSARTLHKSQIKIAFLKVVQVLLFLFVAGKSCCFFFFFSSASVALGPLQRSLCPVLICLISISYTALNWQDELIVYRIGAKKMCTLT